MEGVQDAYGTTLRYILHFATIFVIGITRSSQIVIRSFISIILLKVYYFFNEIYTCFLKR